MPTPLARRMRTLLAKNQTTPRRYEIAASADGTEATVYLYDLIDPYWGVGAAQFVKDLNAITAGTIHLRINSPGGDVFDGRAIATAIRQHKATTIAHVDGLAASAASFVALAADEVAMAPGSMMMIHRASSIGWGNAEDLMELAALLEKIDGQLVDEYVRETGNEADQVKEWLDAETWFTAEEAVTNGFADRIDDAGAKAENRWDLSAFDKAPKQTTTITIAGRALSSEETARWLADQLSAAIQQRDLVVPCAVAADQAHEERLRRFALIEHESR